MTEEKKIQLVDLSTPIMEGQAGMSPVKIEYRTHEDTAKAIAPTLGIEPSDFPEGRFAGSERLTLSAHTGTHMDAPWHYWPTSEGKPSRRIDQVPLEWCYSDGVVLDFTHKKTGEAISITDFQQALKKIDYQLKPLDIVLVMTGVSNKYWGKPEYDRMDPGVGREPTLWLIDQGIKVMGIDAWGWDRPFNVMVEEVKRGIKGKLWEGHYAGKEKEYCHLENLTNLDKIPRSYGFKVAVFPIKITRGSGGWVRAVAIV